MPTCDELATKAELQELRDQLNAVLGEKEDGSNTTLFAKGASNPLIQAGAGLTLLGMAKNVAPKAVVDILLESRPTGTTWQQMASANTGIKAKFGNGTTGSLAGVNAIANTAGSGAGVASTGAKVAGTGAGAVMLLGTLVQVAGTLALNKATVDIFDKRIEAEASGTRFALDQQNSMILRLHEKNQGDMDAINADVENQRIAIVNTQQSVAIAQSDIAQLNNQTSDIYSKLEDANQTIYQLQLQNAEAVAEINQLETELETAKVELLTAVNQVETQLDAALEIIETMRAEAEAQNERIAALEAIAYEIQSRMQVYEIENRNLWDAVQDLREDLDAVEQESEEEAQLREIKSKLASAKLIIEQHRAKLNKGGGGAFATSQAAIAQSGVLKLTNKLGSPNLNLEPVSTTITREDLQNDPQTFRDRFEQLLDRISPDTMTPEEIADLRTGITTGVSTDLTALFGSMIIPRLDNLTDATSERKIAKGVQTGICNSLNGGGCPVTPGNPNPTQGLKGMQNNLGNWLGAGNLLQGQNIAGMVSRIDKTVHHKTWGLEKMQGFASTAWKATKADKIMNGINTVLLIHNAMMLSNNIGQTMSYALGQGLSVIGIKDNSTGEALDINRLVGDKIQSVLKGALGTTNYTALTAKLRAANRVYQTGANILSNVRSIIDSTQSIAETTGENVAVIGNALRQAGAVRENAYSYMPENLNNTSRVLNRLEKISGAASAIEDITSEAVDIKDEVKEMRESQKEFDEAKTKLADEMKKEDETAKSNITRSPEQSEEDEERAKPKE